MELNMNSIREVYDNSPLAFAVIHVVTNDTGAAKDLVLEYENEALVQLVGHTGKEVRDESVYSLFEDTDKKLLQVCGNVAFRGEAEITTEYIHKIKKHIRIQIYKISDGYCGCLVIDVSEQKVIETMLQSSQQELSTIIHNIPGGFFRYDAKTGEFEYISDNMLTMLGYTKEEFTEKFDNKFQNMVYYKDRERVLQEIANQIAVGDTDYCEYSIETKSGELRWFYDEGRILSVGGGKLVFYVVIVDITAKKEMEHALRASEEKFRIATENSDVSFWTYDFSRKAIIQTNSSQTHHGFEKVIENVPDFLVETGHIRKESAEGFVEMYRQLEKGAKTASGDFWTYNDKTKQWWCEHIDYTNIFDENGHPTHAYAVGRDVTAAKMAEKKYRDEVAYADATQSENLLAKVRFNITQNVVESYIAKEAASVSSEGSPYTATAEAISQTGFTKDEQELLRSYFGREQLLKAFSEGHTHVSIDYRRKAHDGSVRWVSTTVKTYQSPDTGDIMSFMYTYDINDDKIKDGIINAVTSLEYDYIAYIDLKKENFCLYHGGENYEHLLPTKSTNYTQSVYDVNRAVVVPTDMQRALLDMLPDGIRENLKKQRVFSAVYSVYDENKNIRQKRVQYAYLDEASEQIVCTRTDVTDLLEQQKQQENMLEAALLAAKQANSAKSDFLSRMSHEIRTPMNAIIGMSTIAAQAIGDDVQVADCIGKIGISSRFLLSLINDILDMSRIESGKMLLKNEKIPFEELLNGINSICYTQAAAKDIDYENIVDPDVEYYYIGDAMKLQQIIINIVSNAIKFTPHHGKVSLRVHQLKKDKNCATIRFVVNDTGCGISEEFIPHLFDPFAQEHSGTTSMYGGTGLGLAICKNLVDMMDGQINVRSIVGTGTEFTVDVKLGITEESRTRYLNKPHYNFEQLKALVVDDDVMVCEDAVITLKEIGVASEWVDSGRKAVARVREKWESKIYYDFVLIDWKMPDMDGIETARQIRKIVGPDVTIIIMTAYDWANIESEAKLAGVNLLMSKPMFKSSLISAFEKALGKQVEQATEIKEDFRFDGKRILLAEDHPLNIEVAKRLLEGRGFLVEVAENGLRALEMFTTTSDGYYDAILMDIRMPQMDGLQAANAIRHLTKKESKTIPIIAMTANAFDEDIQKSKAAGMNAHLAKPIEPQQMYQTLFDFIYGKENPDERLLL